MNKIRFKDYLEDYLEFNNITDKEFAKRIGISQNHLIEILEGKSDLSANVIENISLVTGISESFIYGIENSYKLECRIEDYLASNDLTETKFLNKFKYRYLIDNHYIDFTDVTDKTEIIKDLIKFLRVPSIEKIYEIEENILFKSRNDKPELLVLWLEKCYRKTLTQEIGLYESKNIDYLVSIIKKSAKTNMFDEKYLVEEFNKAGIYLIIEDDVPSSKIRGAFRVHRGKPAIYLTHKHKRVADMYFALLHELAHCKSDFNRAQAVSLVSLDDEKEEIELKADKKAFDWMVSDDYYLNKVRDCRYDISFEETYPKCFVVYRLANDKIIKYDSVDYQKYNPIIQVKND